MSPDQSPVYWADGGGSRAVYDSLQQMLVELRAAVVSDRAIALYQQTGVSGNEFFVLSDSCEVALEPAMATSPCASTKVDGVWAVNRRRRRRRRGRVRRLAAGVADEFDARVEPSATGVAARGLNGLRCKSQESIPTLAD